MRQLWNYLSPLNWLGIQLDVNRLLLQVYCYSRLVGCAKDLKVGEKQWRLRETMANAPSSSLLQLAACNG